MENTCLRCQKPIALWMHRCDAYVMVIHPTVWRDSWRDSNPLDRLTVAEEMKIFGEDPEALVQDLDRQIAQTYEQYLHEPLTFRAELRSVNGLGHQGAIDYWAIEAQGHTDADLMQAVEFLNSEPTPLPSLSKDDTYLLWLVSLNSEGIRYVWKSKKLEHSTQWTLSDWH